MKREIDSILRRPIGRRSLFRNLAFTAGGLAIGFSPGCRTEEEEAPPVDPLVKTSYGRIRGYINNGIYTFRGVRYGATTGGANRFMPPKPPEPWTEIRDASGYGYRAPQTNPNTQGSVAADSEMSRILWASDGFRVPPPESEDCLFLNIWTPALGTGEKRPVMVWLHGGGYAMGNGNDSLINAARLPQHGVVLVNVNMRLNVFGLLAHPLLSQEATNGVSGNYLFLDMIAALKWVQKNIAAFGGDPDNVTIFGESGGGAKVATLMASPLAEGLFHRAICESGTSVGAFSPGMPLNDLEKRGEQLFTRLGVDEESDPLKAVRAIPWEKIMDANQDLTKKMSASGPGGLWDSAVDGWFSPDTPANVFRAGNQHAVPLITCANLGELIGPSTINLSFLVPAYVIMLENMGKIGVAGYACIFDQVPAGWKQEGCVSTHAMELSYVFGDWDNSSSWWTMLYNLASKSGAKQPDPGLTDVDREIAEAMMTMWAQFARTGDPNVKDLIEWPAYEAATDKYLYINEKLKPKSGFSRIVPGKEK